MMFAVDLPTLREALAASWGADTSYGGIWVSDNPALGQCYPTSRVVEHFFSGLVIVKGWVDTGDGMECHFWNVAAHHGRLCHTDLTWQQFPAGSAVRGFDILGQRALTDSAETTRRCETLRRRVVGALDRR